MGSAMVWWQIRLDFAIDEKPCFGFPNSFIDLFTKMTKNSQIIYYIHPLYSNKYTSTYNASQTYILSTHLLNNMVSVNIQFLLSPAPYEMKFEDFPFR
jgi:hypothetical protein